MAMPLVEFPSSLSLGPKVTIEPILGMTVRIPPATPLLHGKPIALANYPAPLYMPQVTIIGTTELMVEELKMRSPVEGLTPLLAKHEPNLAKFLVFILIQPALM